MPTFKILDGTFSNKGKLPDDVQAALKKGGKVVGLQRLSERHSFVVDDGRGWTTRGDTTPPLVQNVAEVTEVTEETTVDVLRGAGWGLLGKMIAGRLGLVAGMFLGARGNATTFALRLKDGSEFLCRGSSRDYARLLADSGAWTTKGKA